MRAASRTSSPRCSRRGGAPLPARGAARDASYRLDVPFRASVQGATERLTLPDGQVLDVKIPPGVVTGQVLRLRGQGGAGRNGGPAGDALIELDGGGASAVPPRRAWTCGWSCR